jgi:hypothetical protein
LKAANRGRKRYQTEGARKKKVHIFTGERKHVKKPANAPAWMPAKIWKPMVSEAYHEPTGRCEALPKSKMKGEVAKAKGERPMTLWQRSLLEALRVRWNLEMIRRGINQVPQSF